MSEVPATEQAITAVENQGTALYQAENRAQAELINAGKKFLASGYDAEYHDELGAQLDAAGAYKDAARSESNKFGSANIDDLREAALREAAQRAADEGAVLYQAENKAKESLNLSIKVLNESSVEEDGGMRAKEAAFLAQDNELAAVQQSNEFAEENMDLLHQQAAIDEAAKRVADVYGASEKPENP